MSTSKKAVEAEPCFIIPPLSEKVESVLPMINVENIAGLSLIKPGVVVSFGNLRLLKLVVEYPDLFEGCQFTLLTGFPKAIYDEAFSQIIWSLDKVSFDELMSELAAAKRISKIRDEQPKFHANGDKKLKEAGIKRFESFEQYGGREEEDQNIGDDDAAAV